MLYTFIEYAFPATTFLYSHFLNHHANLITMIRIKTVWLLKLFQSSKFFHIRKNKQTNQDKTKQPTGYNLLFI